MRYILFACFAALLSCSTNQTNESAYFPLQNFLSARTYVFENNLDTAEKAYWNMWVEINNNDTLFHTEIRNASMQLFEHTVERVKNNSSTFVSYEQFHYYSTGNQVRMPCLILQNQVYRAGMNVKDSLKWKIRFFDARLNDSCTMSKLRVLRERKNDEEVYDDYMNFKPDSGGRNFEYSIVSVYKRGTGLSGYLLNAGREHPFSLKQIKPHE